MNDVQSTLALVLKPPTDFEAIYQGQDGTIPLPFVAVNPAGKWPALDVLAGEPNVASNLENFVEVPLGGSAMILIPKTLASDSGSIVAQSYSYDLRWRMRSVSEGVLPEMRGTPTKSFNLMPELGAPSIPPPLPRYSLPVYTSETLTPSAVGSTKRPLLAADSFVTMSQGIYAPGTFTGANNVLAEDAALGVTYFPPYLKAILGNELSIVAYKSSGNWDFRDTSASGDSSISDLFGINVGGAAHPVYPGVGILLVTMVRNTTP